MAPELKPEALKGLARDGGEPAVITLAGAEKLVKAKRIPGTDWYLVVALDKAEATVGLTQVFNATLIALVVLTLAALAIAS